MTRHAATPVRLGPVRTAGLGHVGPAAAALAAERSDAARTRSTALKRAVRSSVTPTTTAALPSSPVAEHHRHARAEPCLGLVDQAPQVLRR